MKVLVDTSVWSLALIKKTLTNREKVVVEELIELIREFRVVMTGPVRQELLSGISEKDKFEKLKEKLSSFIDIDLNTEDYEKASELYNLCRKKGIQGSHIDFLICAAAINRNICVFTTDKDFIQFCKVIPIKIYKVR
ncbi:MAG: PIN domain-containing protein [Candidatus Delongbacteria bacterium]